MPCANRTTNTDTSYVRCSVLTSHFGKSTARVLQQLHYWLSYENLSYGIIHDNRQWIRNSYNQWHQQIKKTHQDLAIITIRRAFSELEKQGVVLSHCFDDHKNYIGGNQVKSYTIDYDRLESIVGDFNKTLISRPRSIQEQQSSSTTQTHSRAGDTSFLSIVSVHTDAQNVGKKRAANPDQMSTPPDQMSTPLNRYISNKHSKKLSLFRTPRYTEQTQQCFGNTETMQPDKPAERDEINFSKEMINFWNESVEENNPDRKTSLNPKRTQQLNTALKQFFESDLSKWELFCHKITTSKFLMGDITRFKANLDWSIRFETIQRILEGGFSFGDRTSNYTLKLSNVIYGAGDKTRKAPSTSFIPSLYESPKVLAIRDSIKKKVGNTLYASWFLPTEIIVEKNEDGCDEMIICVQSRFMGERLKTHYGDIYDCYFNAYFVGSAEQYVKSRHSHKIVNNAQTLDRVNDDNALEISDPIKNICVVSIYDKHEALELSSSEENIKRGSVADFINKKNFCLQKDTLSNNSSIGVDLAKIETASDILEHEEINLFQTNSFEKSDITNAFLKIPACGGDTSLFNDEVNEQQEISQTCTHSICDMELLSLGHTIKGGESDSDLISGYSEYNKEKSVDLPHKSSAQIYVKPYSSALNDLKIIQIQKKIKNLIPDSHYIKWFQNASIFIEEGRAFLHVSTHNIKRHMQTQFKDVIHDFFSEIRVIEESVLNAEPKTPHMSSRQSPQSESIACEQALLCEEGTLDTLTCLDVHAGRNKKSLHMHNHSQLKPIRDTVGGVIEQNDTKNKAHALPERRELCVHPPWSLKKTCHILHINRRWGWTVTCNATNSTTAVRAISLKRGNIACLRTCDLSSGIVRLKQGRNHGLVHDLPLTHHVCVKPPDVEKKRRRPVISSLRFICSYFKNNKRNTGPPWFVFREPCHDASSVQTM